MGLFIAQLLTGLANAATLFLVASGLSLIFGVTRIVNFAHGSFYMLGAYMGYTLMQVLPGAIGFWASVLLSGVIVGLIGVVVEMLVLRPVYKAPELFQLVATFGVILVIQDLALMVWGAEDLLGPRAPGLKGIIRVMGEPVPLYDLALIAITPFVLFALWYLISRTRVGILVRAATQDREMVAALGVNQSWLFTGVFFLGAGLAGLGGAIQLPKGGADLLMDFNILAAIFVVVVIGGMGSLPGAYIAAVLISVLNVFGVSYLPQSTLVLMYVVMAIVLTVRPYGLLGREEVVGEHGQVGEPERPIKPAGNGMRLLVVALLLGLMALPMAGSHFLLILSTDIIIFCLFAASLHFLLGLGGLVSFGHAAYFGGGAYVAGLLVSQANAPMELAFLLAPIGAAMGAFIIGWLCLRLTGVYFAMLTLAMAQLLWSLVFQWDEFTGGDDGLVDIWPAAWLSETNSYFYFTVVVGVGGIILLRHIAHTPFGYALRASRDSQRQAEATGIDTKRIQWMAFTLAGGMAGLAGALFIFSKGSVFPNELEIAKSFDGLIVVFLGGVKTLSGGVVGAASLELVKDYLTRFEYWRLALGLLIIFVVVLAPNGIVGSLRKLYERVRGESGDSAMPGTDNLAAESVSTVNKAKNS
ncbi:ABC transporter permease [Granulosicoccus antarcticus]|uniref:High-affinity branched-chain amino acid transport system permease protein LivH n=1 Tax=Granulosicoccus antarcticus IMCC3135 TaxID=1192854 RepID=A0A2Z2NW31_9GAMM|nr:ABC transporter permease [Granulosicoccus antarcticus]ASJ71364.1 High-affinity branched-chain amino acid transport system permease protein LivH [Granulosicoccus antarcticus IMCC3135]